MTFWQCFISLMPFVLAAGVFFGVVYPAVMIVIYKSSGSRMSIREIIKRI